MVTGASAGVGRAVAVRFARSGWRVGLLARGREGLDGAVREIRRFGGEALAIVADVADPDAVEAAAARIERELGPISVWVNSAMVTVYGPIVEVSPAEILQVTRVTYLGQVHGAQAALRVMRPRNAGTIVSIGSALAYRSIPFQGPYCAAKAATRAFMDSLRSELIAENSRIRLTAIHLPAVNTPQFDWARSRFDRKLAPVRPIFQPETVADAVYRAAGRAPREIWLGVPAVKAILAQILAPSIADRVLGWEGPSSQTVDEPADPARPDNLFEAGRGDPGSHGRFDGQARDHAIPFNPAWLRAGAAMAGIGTLAALAGLALARRRARPAARRLRQGSVEIASTRSG